MQNETAPRLVPLMPAEWDDTVREALGAFPKSLEFVLSQCRAGVAQPRGVNVLGVMAHYPALAKAFMTLNAHVAGASTLPVRERELVILRMSWLGRSEYEYAQHLILGRRAGLSDAEMARVQDGPDAPGWDPQDADLVRAVDELHGAGGIAEPTWTRLAARWSREQLMDLVVLVGFYALLGWVLNSFAIPMEPELPPLEPAVRAKLLGTPAG